LQAREGTQKQGQFAAEPTTSADGRPYHVALLELPPPPFDVHEQPLGAPIGPIGTIGSLGGSAEEIAISAARLRRVVNLHTILKLGPRGKSAFVIGEDIVKLIKGATTVRRWPELAAILSASSTRAELLALREKAIQLLSIL